MKQKHIEKIDDFVKTFTDDMLITNGLNTFLIRKPINDEDALVEGFKTMNIYQEQKRGWKILSAKNVIIRETNYRAVLDEYKNKQYIVLYKEQNESQYYFRIYDTSK